MIKKIFGFLKGVVSGCFKYLMDFVNETISNAPAAAILVTSSIGVTAVLYKIPVVTKFFAPIPWVNEAMVCIVLGIVVTYSLALLAQVWNYEYEARLA